MIKKVFIPPTAPLPELGAKWFVERFKERLQDIPITFDKILVLTPTRAAAKNLHNSIFAECIAQGIEGISELTITTLEDELSQYQQTSQTATSTEIQASIIATLSEIELSDLNGLFPCGIPIRKDFLNIAKEIEFLKDALAENLMSISDASKMLADSPDAERWENLAKIEILFEEKLTKVGLFTHLQSLKKSLENSASSGVDTVVVIGNPDISVPLKEFLNLSEANGKEVEIVAFAKDENKFDKFATPLAPQYCDTELPLQDSDIKIYANIKKQAQAVAVLASNYNEKVYDTLAIACEQNEAVEFFKDELAKVGVNAITLESETLEHTTTYSLIRAIKEYCNAPTFTNFLNIVRNPFISKKFQNELKKTEEEILSDLDFIGIESACANVPQARSALYARLHSPHFSEDRQQSRLIKIKYLRDIFDFSDECIALPSPAERVGEFILKLLPPPEFENQARAIMVLEETLREIESAEKKSNTHFERNEIFTLLLEHLKATSMPLELDDDRLALQDWMEIFWSPSPHVVLCDMNDGIVPLANSDGLFLNDTIRKKLSMRHQQLRQARDAYMLETLLLSRQNVGTITVSVPKRNSNGDPLMPSRILFQTSTLPERTKLLFQEPTEIEIQQRTTAEWNLNVERLAYKGNYSATRLTTYLNSAWQFYLQFVLGMESVEIFRDEIDALQFGNIFHKTMYNFANSELKDSADEKKIAKYLAENFDEVCRENFGTNIRTQVRIQLENLRNRIISCAKPQSERRQQGWKIVSAEMPFAFQMFGRKFTGVFDRVDRNEKTGTYAVIDYKTYDKFTPNIAKENHIKLRKHKDKDDEIEWKNLQLPLYLLAAKGIFDNAKIECAYFVAPKNVSDCSISVWEDIEDFEESAKEKILEIVENIEAGNFTPNEAPKYDNYADIFRIDFETLKECVRFQK